MTPEPVLCRKCGSPQLWRSNLGGWARSVGSLVGLHPLRCSVCNHRFWAFTRTPPPPPPQPARERRIAWPTPPAGGRDTWTAGPPRAPGRYLYHDGSGADTARGCVVRADGQARPRLYADFREGTVVPVAELTGRWRGPVPAPPDSAGTG